MQYTFGTYGEIAHSDLETAIIIYKTSKIAKVTVFYAQQACEKILKHYLQLKLRNDCRLENLIRTYKLKRLCMAAEIDALEPYRADISDLQDAYIDGRYPGDDYTLPTLEKAGKLLKSASEIVRIVDNAIEEYCKKQTAYFTFNSGVGENTDK